MRKGIASQVFIYIFAAIVIAMILFFGFKQAVNLKNLAEKSSYVAFKSDFTKAVDSAYYLNKGSVISFEKSSRNKPLDIPKEIKKICFENSRVMLNSEKYQDFTVNNLYGNECINADNGKLSFRLENAVEDGESIVKISSVGT